MRRWGWASVSGCLIIFCVPSFLWPTLAGWQSAVGWVALIPVFYVLLTPSLTPTQGGLLMGTTWMIAMAGIHYWLFTAPLLAWRGPIFWVGLSLLLGFLRAGFGVIAVWGWRRFQHRAPWVGLLLWLPSVWVSLEWVQQKFMGFSWPYALTQHSWPALVQWTSLGGTALLSWFLMSFTSTVAYAFHQPPASRRKFLLLAAFELIVLASLGSSRFYIYEPSVRPRQVEVAILQGARPLEVPRSLEELDVYKYMIAPLHAAPPTIICWPEGAVPFFPDLHPTVKEPLLRIIRASHTHHLVGGYEPVFDPNPTASPPTPSLPHKEGEKENVVSEMNCVWLYDPTGQKLATYRKRHPFPFGERLPFFPRLLGWAVLSQFQLTPGTDPPLMATPWGPIGVPICNELLMDSEIAWLSRQPMEAMFSVTNDIWMGDTAGPAQHLMVAIFRAVETGVPIVRISNSGISAIISPLGTVLASLPYGTRDILRHPLPPKIPLPLGQEFQEAFLYFTVTTVALGICFVSFHYGLVKEGGSQRAKK